MRDLRMVLLALAVLASVPMRGEVAGSAVVLPDAPVPNMSGMYAEGASGAGAAQESAPVGEASGESTVVGSVNDPKGEPILGAVVTLEDDKTRVKRTVTVDSRGEFEIAKLPAGKYKLLILLPGMPDSEATEVELGAKQEQVLPIVMSRTPTQETTIRVVASTEQVAQEQVKLEEKQRVLGVVPNFYTSYIWNSAPLTPKLKFKLAFRASVDPVDFAVSAAVAGVEQERNTFPGYGTGAQGYAKRYGAAYADRVVSDMVGRALLPVIFHQDPRYFYRGTGSKGSRAWYAIKSTFVTRGDDGSAMPNYSRVLGIFATAGIANIYRASSDRDAGTTVQDAFIGIGGSAVSNIVREFISRPLTKNVPVFATGKAAP